MASEECPVTRTGHRQSIQLCGTYSGRAPRHLRIMGQPVELPSAAANTLLQNQEQMSQVENNHDTSGWCYSLLPKHRKRSGTPSCCMSGPLFNTALLTSASFIVSFQHVFIRCLTVLIKGVPKMQSPCPVAIPAASPILSGLSFTPESFWAAMSQGTASKIAWISVIQHVKEAFHADLSSWGNLNVCDYGDCISQKRWMQICALLSSPVEEFQIGQQAIDELASLGSNFGFLGRKEAEALLLEKPTKGMLIRFSDSSDGLCAASINTGLGVFHLRLCRRWPGETGTWMDCKGVVAYKPMRRHERAGWYVVHKENEQQQPGLEPADSLKQLVEVSLVRFLGVWLHSRC
ncbi:hypothetical protein Pelo_18837 [Pelomyxa schiedti]|nr:hypothetical protein Pelo_18837 [Pelomyxa schiedti]